MKMNEEVLPLIVQHVKEKIELYRDSSAGNEFDKIEDVCERLKVKAQSYADGCHVEGLPVISLAPYYIEPGKENTLENITSHAIKAFKKDENYSLEEQEEAMIEFVSCLCCSINTAFGHEDKHEIVLCPIPEASPVRSALIWQEPMSYLQLIIGCRNGHQHYGYEISAVEKDFLDDNEILTRPNVVFDRDYFTEGTPVVLLAPTDNPADIMWVAKELIEGQTKATVICCFTLGWSTLQE